MKNEQNPNTDNALFALFVDQINDMVSSENQIIQALPKCIQKVTNEELKKALTKHLQETKEQAQRLEHILSLLSQPKKQTNCPAMEGILREVDEMVNQTKPAALDAAIIAACQKVEHYEIATYGTLRSFADQLELEDEIDDLLKKTLDEEAAADKKLTKIAEGSLFSFSDSVNKLAASGPSRK